MVLEPKQTTVAYRCTKCGAGVMSVVGLFNLKADMVKLKCDCGESAMTLVYTKDSKVRITVPCVLCPNPHNYTVSNSIFFKDDLFLLPCPYSDLNIAMMGETNQVKAELSKGELELWEILEKSGINSLEDLRPPYDYNSYANPEVVEVITSTIRMLDAEGKIECNCTPKEGDYELDLSPSVAELRCKKCNCVKKFNTDSIMEAHMLVGVDKLKLEFQQ